MSDITVLVGARTHAVSGRPVRSRSDAAAAALALGVSGKARLLTAGAMPEAVARDYLALGAPLLEMVECSEDADVSASLLPTLRDVPWVVAGTRPESEHGTGALPYALAAALGRPVIADVLAIEPEGAAWIVTQALPKGARRRLRVHPPAVLVVSATAPQAARHSLADAMAGRIVRTPLQTPAPASAPSLAPAGQRVASSKRRKLLEARTQQSGHARMLGAIESPSTGGTVLQAGDPHTKAQAVLDYLRTHSLVHF